MFLGVFYLLSPVLKIQIPIHLNYTFSGKKWKGKKQPLQKDVGQKMEYRGEMRDGEIS